MVRQIKLLHSVRHLRHFIALLAFRVAVLPLGLAPAFLGFFLAAALLDLGAPHCLVLVARLQSLSDQFMPMMQSAMKSGKFSVDGFESDSDKVASLRGNTRKQTSQRT